VGSGLRALKGGEGTRGLLEWTDRWARSAVHWASLNGHAEALAVLLEYGANPAPRLITSHQMAKRTHLAQEQPLTLATRVHGADSAVARILSKAVAVDSKQQSDEIVGSEVNATAANTGKVVSSTGSETESLAYLLTLGSETGLDKLAVWELRERLAATNVKRVRCRIFFTSQASPSHFSSLKSAEKICAVVINAQAEEVTQAIEKGSNASTVGCTPELSVAQWILQSEHWDSALKRWWEFNMDASVGGVACTNEKTLTFKVTCRRSGKRFGHISSQGLALAVATSLTAKRGWRAQVRQPDLEVRVLLSDSELLVDIPFLVQGVIPIGGGELVSAGLAAPVAWALARTAELKPGDRVLDPMCGKAVILIEASLSWPSCEYLGLDIDQAQLQGASSNAQLLVPSRSGSGRLDLLFGDARRLPLPTGSVDALVCDVPFGKQHGTLESCREDYIPLFQEFDRVVSKGSHGRAIVLSSLEQEAWVTKAAGLLGAPEGLASSSPPWVCTARRELRLGTLEAVIIVLRRPSEAAAAAAAAAGVSAGELPPLSKRLWWETHAGRGSWASLKISQRPPMQLARCREI